MARHPRKEGIVTTLHKFLKARRRMLAAALLSTLATTLAAEEGIGSLLVAPTRVVFGGTHRTAEISLINTGNRAATYRISLIRLRMNERGDVAEIQEGQPGERFANALVRFSPRQVTLEPRVAQTVRIALRKPADLETGEYRSHLLFRALPSSDAPAEESKANGVSIRLIPIFGVSIPVIVRHGALTSLLLLEGSRLVDSAPGEQALEVTLRREGDSSVYGNLEVAYLPAKGGRVEVGRVQGVAVYTPNLSRLVRIPLPRLEAGALGRGRLEVTFIATDSVRPMVALAEIALP
jgi:P pilus assembly chaperone PapD